jgi:hypothetical protein
MMKRSVDKILFSIISTFERDVTNFRGTFVENVKKSSKSTQPTTAAPLEFFISIQSSC